MNNLIRKYQINIVELENAYEEAFNKWWEEDESGVKDMLWRGKNLSLGIAKARKEKYQYIDFKGLIININEKAHLIPNQDLTRNRFFALLHRFIHKKYQNENEETKKDTYKVSALVMKVNFTSDCCLTPFRFLLGTGFQYQSDMVLTNRPTSSVEDKVTFIIGCMILDWLASISEKSPTIKMMSQFRSFKDYALSEDARSGQVLSAGAKNMGDGRLTFLEEEASVKILQDALDHISFNMKGNVMTHRLEALRKAIGRCQLTNAINIEQ